MVAHVTDTSWVVRRATPADVDVAVSLHREFCAIDGHPFDADRARAAFEPLLADDTVGMVWLVDDAGGGPIGYAVLTWGWSIEAGGCEAVLDEIYVAARRQGIGSALLGHVVDAARSRGVARIFLETESHNATVRSLYARHGFEEDDSIWMSLELVDLS